MTISIICDFECQMKLCTTSSMTMINYYDDKFLPPNIEIYNTCVARKKIT